MCNLSNIFMNKLGFRLWQLSLLKTGNMFLEVCRTLPEFEFLMNAFREFLEKTSPWWRVESKEGKWSKNEVFRVKGFKFLVFY